MKKKEKWKKYSFNVSTNWKSIFMLDLAGISKQVKSNKNPIRLSLFGLKKTI